MTDTASGMKESRNFWRAFALVLLFLHVVGSYIGGGIIAGFMKGVMG